MTLQNRNKEIRRVRVADILDNPANYRTHDELQRGALQAVVQEIGWYGYPDVFEHPEHPGKVMLVDGELRSDHLRQHYGPDAMIDVNVTDFTPGEADKALATKDPLSAMAGQDIAREAELLRSLEAESEGFAGLIEQLAAADRIDLHPLPAEVWDEAEIPEPSAELAERHGITAGQVKLMRGQGLHRILVGDPGNAEHVAALFCGQQPFMLIGRPPAGNTGTCYRLFHGPVAYLFYTPETCVELVGHLHTHNFEIRAQLIWRHETEDDPHRREYNAHHTAAFYVVRKGESTRWNGSRTESTVWHAPVPPLGALPIHVAGRPILNHGGPDEGIFDPFGGNGLGSVAVAAERLSRPSFTMCETAEQAGAVAQRLAQEGTV